MEPNPKLKFSLILALLQTIPSCFCQTDHRYLTCKQPFNCGSIGKIGYPFWGGSRDRWCGLPGFQLICQDNITRILMPPLLYRVLEIHSLNRTLQISRDDLWPNLCTEHCLNTTFDFTPFDFYSPANDQTVTLYYGCPPDKLPLSLSNYRFDCGIHKNFFQYPTTDASNLEIGSTCGTSISVQVTQKAAQSLAKVTTARTYLLQNALKSGFSVRWLADNENCKNCQRSGGSCGYNLKGGSFACYCADRPYAFACNGTHPRNGMY